MSGKVDRKIPIHFQKLHEVESTKFGTDDGRFMRVKIWLMHTGENYNGSFFTKQSVEGAIPTLEGMPIVGYLENNSAGQTDFSDHREGFVQDESGQWKIQYLGSAFGFVPKDHNAQFEMKVGDDGVEREYLTCEGVVWTKFDSAVDIFQRDVVKSQSMELADDFDGYVDETSGLFHFTKFKFDGACALGFDVQPAMESATIGLNFSAQENVTFDVGVVFAQIEEKRKAFQDIEGGEVKMDREVPDVKTAFAYTAQQKKEMLKATLMNEGATKDEWGYMSRKFWYLDHSDSHVFAESKDDNWGAVQLPYAFDADGKANIDFTQKVICVVSYVPAAEAVAGSFAIKSVERSEYEIKIAEAQVEGRFSNMADELKEGMVEQAEFDTVKTERDELLAFKRQIESEKKDAVIANFMTQYEGVVAKEDIVDIETVKDELSVADIETRLFAVAGRKVASKFAAQKGGGKVHFAIEEDRDQPKPDTGWGQYMSEE